MANGFSQVCLRALTSLAEEQRQLALVTGPDERTAKCTSILDKLSVQSENPISYLPKCAAVWADIEDQMVDGSYESLNESTTKLIDKWIEEVSAKYCHIRAGNYIGCGTTWNPFYLEYAEIRRQCSDVEKQAVIVSGCRQ